MGNDLTIIFLTVNKLPQGWVKYHKGVLLEAAGDYPIITVSAKPTDMPGANIIQSEPFNASNIYRQMLRAAKLATTSFLAVVEDDSLYPREHFIKFRPEVDEFAYNYSRWSLFSWGEPTYYWTKRISNLTLIAPRELLIQALEERFAKYPDGTPEDKTGELGRVQIEKGLELPHYKSVDFYTTIPVVNLNHVHSIDPYEKSMRKRRGFVRAYDIPFWRKASTIQRKFV
jgi:hypothetical protein